MSDLAHHESLRLVNFTAFGDASFEFVPGVNVFVGVNGTGKTHAMKVLYGWQLIHSPHQIPPGLALWGALFQVQTESDLARLGVQNQGGFIQGVIGGQTWKLSYSSKSGTGTSAVIGSYNGSKTAANIPVFVPAIDMLGHTKGFSTTYDRFEIDFDLTHRDIVGLLLGPTQREMSSDETKIATSLEGVIEAKLQLEGERFYFVTPSGRFPAPMVAEGLRKVATLLRLVQCGWLKPGTTLFWDEPEVNLNPLAMRVVVTAILSLARMGVQVFLATHNYVVLEELRDQAEQGEVRYFGFSPSPDGVTVQWVEDLACLKPNPILDEYEHLSNQKLRKAFAPRMKV